MTTTVPAHLSASVDLKIPFHDMDPTGVVWHGRYFKYFERAREALMEQLDYSYPEMRSSGYVFPVVDAQVRYVRPLRLGQSYRITAVLKEWELRVVVQYTIVDAAGEDCTRGKTVQVAVTAKDWSLQLGCPMELQDKVTHKMAGMVRVD
ncbi:MAG: thioesterase family protein [Xanthomonadales bacterium]|nr:thioesterase family protein [Xanthomonadales bacterium]